MKVHTSKHGNFKRSMQVLSTWKNMNNGNLITIGEKLNTWIGKILANNGNIMEVIYIYGRILWIF